MNHSYSKIPSLPTVNKHSSLRVLGHAANPDQLTLSTCDSL